jgi:HEAT repeat protein
MPATMDQVLEILEAEEPDYGRGVELGPDALPHLATLAAGPDSGLAAKAVSLAASIQDERSTGILQEAAQSSDPIVRVAAANAAPGLPDEAAASVLLALLDDQDLGVRKVALSSVGDSAPDELQAKVAQLSESDEVSELRDLSKDVLRRLTA